MTPHRGRRENTRRPRKENRKIDQSPPESIATVADLELLETQHAPVLFAGNYRHGLHQPARNYFHAERGNKNDGDHYSINRTEPET